MRSYFLLLTFMGCAAQIDGGDQAPRTPEFSFVEAAPADCFSAEASLLPVVALPGTFSLGEFFVQLDGEGHLQVTHQGDSSRSLFATPSGEALLRVARATLQAEEHQGSFELSATTSVSCEMPYPIAAHYGEGSLSVRGGFGDCASLQWEVQLCQARAGHLAFQVTTSDPSFNEVTLKVASEASERIFGMGEQFAQDRLDLKGRLIPVISQEGGVGRGHAPITPAVNLASNGSGGSEESTYYAAPHYLTNRLRSLFLENTEYAEFDFQQPSFTALRVYAPTMTGRILFGKNPLELIERFTDYAGRMPVLPSWVNDGAIIALAKDVPSSVDFINALLSHGVAISAVWNQTWSGKVTTFIGEQVLWNWSQSAEEHPLWPEYVNALADAGIRTLCYVNPMFVDPSTTDIEVSRNLFAEGMSAGYFVKKQDNSPYLLKATAFDVGLLDLTNNNARAWMKDVIKDELLTNAGCSGWMADFAEALPFDAKLASGQSAASFHNQYPVEWAKLNREAIEEAGRLGDVVIFNRSGAARTPSYSLLLWEGDQLTTWDKYDGMVSALHGLINGGFSGISLNHSDTGGYTSLSLWGIAGYEREEEQLKRWTEMNAFTAVLRTHEGNQPGVNAQVYSNSEAMEHFAKFSQVYKALGFYRQQLFQEAATKGWPVVRHLWLQYPSDTTAQQIDDEFLLGSEILVAPIKNKCWTWPVCPYDKELYLPAGEWVHLWSGEVFGSVSQGSYVTVQAPIGEPAVFYKKGSSVGATFVTNLQDAGIL